jgi:hypothetical protein
VGGKSDFLLGDFLQDVPTEDAEGKLTHDTIAYSVRYAPIQNRAAGYPALPMQPMPDPRQTLGARSGRGLEGMY